MIGALCRSLAVAIAIASLVDPPLTTAARGRPRIAVALQRPDTPISRRAYDGTVAALRHDFEVARGPDDSAAALVVVGSNECDVDVADGQRVYTVTAAPSPAEPDVRVAAVRAPVESLPVTRIHLEADIDAANARGVSSTLVARIGNIEVGRATHLWSDAQRWNAALDVPTVGPPPWRLRVEVSAAPGERALTDNVADVAVDAAAPARVLVFEPRPSWAATFVRRALEGDRRFETIGISHPTRGIAVTTATTSDLSTIDLESVRTVVVGGLDTLSAGDADVLVRYMREQNGSVVLLPDALADVRAMAQRLPVPLATEVLLEKAAALSVEPPLPAFEVSEMLKVDAPSGAIRVVARASGTREPVIAIAPVGAGRLLVSGALDAWRYRANDAAAFDRFWQATIAGLAMATRPAIDVEVRPSVVAPGDDVRLRVRVSGSASRASSETRPISGKVVDTDIPIRVWPDASSNAFHASFAAPRAVGVHHAAITMANHTTAAAFIVAADARAARPNGPPLAMLAESHGGIDVAPDRIPELVQRLGRDIAAPTARVERRPMRSIWWMLPFASCLSAEWWLRRRRGLR